MMTSRFVLAATMFLIAGSVTAGDLFRDDVAPILERKCLRCHDDLQREGGLSLQTKAELRDSGHLDQQDPAASRLMEVLEPVDGEAEMPKDGERLSEDELAIIRRWIVLGARWPDNVRLETRAVIDSEWWSYSELDRPVVPRTTARTKTPVDENPIDAFIRRTLHDHGLETSKEADLRTLLRRVTYDLTGLPPTPKQVDRFLKDRDPKSYERVVDGLLDSNRYGERWARHWLDVVKYADTCGYDKDKLRPAAWPYRDYVIRSFNEDKPYARFVREQVAGDVLYPGEADGILGLGFIAAGPWDFIGHVEVPESKLDGLVARNLDRDDMVSNTLNSFCSLTVQCARCHHHKFDPITQQQYYGSQAIFAAVDRAERPYDLDPGTEQRRQEIKKRIASSRDERKAIEQKIRDEGGEHLAALRRQEAELREQLKLVKDARFGYHSALSSSATVEKWVQVDLAEPAFVREIRLHPCHDDFGGIGSGFGFPVRYRVEIAVGDDPWEIVHDQTRDDVPNPGLDSVVIELSKTLVDRIRVTAVKLAPRKGDFMFALAELEAFDEAGGDVLQNSEVSSLDSIQAPPRWNRQNLIDGLWPHYENRSTVLEWRKVVQARDQLLSGIDSPERQQRRKMLQREQRTLEAELSALPAGKMVYAAATHFDRQSNFLPTEGKPRKVSVLIRGEVSQPSEPATPGMLPLFPNTDWQLGLESDEGKRRAALAEWLTAKANPLTWRSIVNRVWLYHFGRGIVETPNDFGRMGSLPTHPDLLDWLAVEFRDGGRFLEQQSFKSLHRLIVTSRVYRQSSRHDANHANSDAGNRYLWRMERRRLEAEEIRDSILAVSGALDETMGGPGFRLFELERPEHSPHYEYHKFDPSEVATHRRSIYRFIVRSQPDPWMTTLDCADSSQSTPRRNETLTSLQALSLLNNRFNLVMAQRFAERVRQSASDPADQVREALQLVTQREPSQDEIDEMVDYADQHGLENLCRFLFNLSEFIYLD